MVPTTPIPLPASILIGLSIGVHARLRVIMSRPLRVEKKLLNFQKLRYETDPW